MKMEFNSAKADTMHIDINSCFATVEQQFDKSLRGKSVVVAARNCEKGCIVAPSIEAKTFGIKTGMRVFEARKLNPDIIVLAADPPKYRYIHKKMYKLLKRYTARVIPKSIDEFVLQLKYYPAGKCDIKRTANRIKKEIKTEVGDWIKVSVGIGPNIFLAKVAAGMEKPDGLQQIDIKNYTEMYKKLELRDLHGIGMGNLIRLNNKGIFTVPQFYNASHLQLTSIFQSINAYYWYMRLRGWEIDDYKTCRRGFSQSYVLMKHTKEISKLAAITQKLVEKMGVRLREEGYSAKGVFLMLRFTDKSKQSNHILTEKDLYTSLDIYKQIYRLFRDMKINQPVRQIALGVFHLNKFDGIQLNIFEDRTKSIRLAEAIDKVNSRWSQYTVIPAQLLDSKEDAPDAIAFGK